MFAVATPQLLEAGRSLGALPGAGFSLMGADFLLTEKLQPVLLEVNALPSLARKVDDIQVICLGLNTDERGREGEWRVEGKGGRGRDR